MPASPKDMLRFPISVCRISLSLLLLFQLSLPLPVEGQPGSPLSKDTMPASPKDTLRSPTPGLSNLSHTPPAPRGQPDVPLPKSSDYFKLGIDFVRVRSAAKWVRNIMTGKARVGKPQPTRAPLTGSLFDSCGNTAGPGAAKAKCPEPVAKKWKRNCQAKRTHVIDCSFANEAASLFAPPAENATVPIWSEVQGAAALEDLVSKQFAPWLATELNSTGLTTERVFFDPVHSGEYGFGLFWVGVRNNTLVFHRDFTMQHFHRGNPKPHDVYRATCAFTHIKAALKGLSEKNQTLPDVDMSFFVMDSCFDSYNGWQSIDHLSRTPPVFGYISCLYSAQVHFPVTLPAHSMRKTMLENKVSWQEKRKELFFRGRSGERNECWPNIMHRKGERVLCGRQRVAAVNDCQLHPQWNLHATQKHANSPCYVPHMEQLNFQFVLYVEGNWGWSNRLEVLILYNTVVFKVESYSNEWFASMLVPWVHYIPVDYYLSNLQAHFEWALAHPEACARIAQNLQAFAELVFRDETIHAYIIKTLIKYHSLFRPENQVRPHGFVNPPEQCNGYRT
eukprot:gb/GEZN01004697.1/.p1 GENE.gb/GEZN01004697.1/~~gb/GEZN01004697.1/.p1  ORF type:complete len:561 (+),score=52.53 gb/GEZN01004697.1/:1-1683(+)